MPALAQGAPGLYRPFESSSRERRGAQASGPIAGVARDESGAVLPGVTVEVASPALIEKVRNAISDSEGQCRRAERHILSGWGKRNYTWQTQAILQHQLIENVGVTFGYFRTSYGNFRVTSNDALTPADYDSYCLTAPADARFAEGGGSPICGLFDVKPANFGQSAQVVRLASDFGDYNEVYHGFDLILNARLPNLFVTGGLNTGRTTVDYCDVVEDNPQVVPVVATFTQPRNSTFCSLTTPFKAQTQVKVAAIYTLPYQVQASVSYQYFPGVTQSANIAATNAVIAPSLGRNLSAGGNAQVVVDVLPQHRQWEDPSQQTDVRFIKSFGLGGTRRSRAFSTSSTRSTPARSSV